MISRSIVFLQIWVAKQNLQLRYLDMFWTFFPMDNLEKKRHLQCSRSWQFHSSFLRKKKRSGAFSGFPRLSILHQLSMLMVANDPHFSQRNKRCLRRAHQLRGTAGMDFCCWHRDVKNDWNEECDNIFKHGVLNYGKCDVFRYGSLEKVGTIVFLARNDSVWEVLRLFLSWLCFGDVQHGYDFSIDVSSEVHPEPKKATLSADVCSFLLVFVESPAQKTVKQTLSFSEGELVFWYVSVVYFGLP